MTRAGRVGRLPGWLARLLFAMLVSQVAIFLVRPVLTYRVIDLGGGEREVGLLLAGYALLPALVAIPIGRYSDRHRPAPVLRAGILLLLAGCAGLALAGNLVTVGLATVVLGLGALATMVGVQMVVARRSEGDRLDHHFGLTSAAASLGQMVGPVTAGLVLGGADHRDTTIWAFALGGVLCLVALAGCWGFAEPAARAGTSRPERAAGHRSLSLLRRPGVAGSLLVSLSLLTAVDLLIGYLPLLGERRGIAPAAVGALLSLRAAASVASRVLIPPMLARWGRVRLLVASVCGSGVLLALLPLVGSAWLMAALLVGAGFFLGLGQPLTMAVVVQAAPAHAHGAALSLRITSNKVGQVVVPAGVGLAAGAAGVAWVFPLIGAVLLGSALGVPRRRPPSENGGSDDPDRRRDPPPGRRWRAVLPGHAFRRR